MMNIVKNPGCHIVEITDAATAQTMDLFVTAVLTLREGNAKRDVQTPSFPSTEVNG